MILFVKKLTLFQVQVKVHVSFTLPPICQSITMVVIWSKIPLSVIHNLLTINVFVMFV